LILVQTLCHFEFRPELSFNSCPTAAIIGSLAPGIIPLILLALLHPTTHDQRRIVQLARLMMVTRIVAPCVAIAANGAETGIVFFGGEHGAGPLISSALWFVSLLIPI